MTANTKPRVSPRDLLLTISVVALLGFSFVPIKIGLREVPPFALAGLRFFFAGIPLAFFMKKPSLPWRFIAGYGAAIGIVQFGLVFLAIQLGMPAGLSSLVIQTQVFFTIGLAIALLGDKLQTHNVIGAIIAACGILLLAAIKLASGLSGTFIGFVLILVAAFAWSMGNIIAKRAAGEYKADMFALVVWSSLIPPLPLFALSYWFEGGPAAVQAVLSASPLTWLCVFTLSWGATLFGFGSWARLLHRYPTALIAPFALLIPVSGLASGAIFLDESLAPMQLLGVVLVFLGLAENVLGADIRAWLARRTARN